MDPEADAGKRERYITDELKKYEEKILGRKRRSSPWRARYMPCW